MTHIRDRFQLSGYILNYKLGFLLKSAVSKNEAQLEFII